MPIPPGRQGVVHGGQEPVKGATVQLYAVGTAGDGSAATALLSPATTTGADGGFTLTGLYTCPSASALVYLVATGGNPGLGGMANNADLAMMSTLGQCGALGPSTFIVVDELTTVAGVYSLAPFMSSASAVGSVASDASALATAFTVSSELVDTTTGMAPGTGVPAGTLVPVAQIDTIGDILAGCVNSAGGVLGDSSPCGQLLSLTAVSGAAPVTDTVGALLRLAGNPGLNTAALYNLAAPVGPFEPAQPQTPPDLAVRLIVPGGLTVSTTVLNFPATRQGSASPAQTIAFTNNTATPIGIDLPATLASNVNHISGTDPSDFGRGALSNCTTPILAGATCVVSFVFTPAGTGSRSAYLTVNNTSVNPAIGIPMTGLGLEANSGPAYLSTGAAQQTTALNLTSAGTPTNVTLTNNGSMPLTIDSITISNDPASGQAAFSQTNTCGATLAAQSSCTIGISAIATTQPYSTGVLTVGDDAQNGPQTLNLSYSNGFSGPLQMNFGSISIGAQDSLDADGIGGPLDETLNFSVAGPDAADFTNILTSPSPCVIERFQPTCGVAITFLPSALGLRTATLEINGSPFTGMAGVGLPAGVQFSVYSPYNPYSPNSSNPTISSVSFGSINVGQSSPTTLTILNTGTVATTLNAPALSGVNAADFSVTSQCMSSIAPGGTCSVTVTASPSQPTTRMATLTLTDSTLAVQQVLPLAVLGMYTAPVATPSSLTFSYTPLGTISPAQSFMLTSYNNDPVSVKVGLGLLSPFVLTQASTCAQTPCQIYVAYAPTTYTTAYAYAGNSFDNLYVTDLFSGQAFLVSLMGTITPPPVTSWTVLPTSLTFGTQTVGTTSAAQNIVLTNTGNQEIDFSVVEIGYYNYFDYSWVNTCKGVVLAGASCTIPVTFSPAGAGTRPYILEFYSNAPSSPDLITLTGTGQ